MIESINKKLIELGLKHRIKIIFAVESGSRSWNMSSANSDYDVRFVFYHPLESYISISTPADVIVTGRVEGTELEFEGFDIFKFSKMLHSSNPSVIEWLRSKIVYYGIIPEEWKRYAEESFNPISLFFHYKSMCKQNYLKYLKTGSMVTYKKYLYAMRGLVNAGWVASSAQKGVPELPPIDFQETVTNAVFLPESVRKKLMQIIMLKKDGREEDLQERIPGIDSYIENVLKDDSDAPKSHPVRTTTDLDAVLRIFVMNGVRG